MPVAISKVRTRRGRLGERGDDQTGTGLAPRPFGGADRLRGEDRRSIRGVRQGDERAGTAGGQPLQIERRQLPIVRSKATKQSTGQHRTPDCFPPAHARRRSDECIGPIVIIALCYHSRFGSVRKAAVPSAISGRARPRCRRDRHGRRNTEIRATALPRANAVAPAVAARQAS